MSVSIDQIRNAVLQARSEAQIAGIDDEYLDAVTAVLAVFDMTGLRDAQDDSQATSPTLIIPETYAEWADNYNISTHYDRFLAAAVWLYNRGQATLTTTDILEMYDRARWKKPKNAADVFAKAAQRLYFTEAEEESNENDSQKSWRLTRTGLSYFQSLKYEQELT